MQFLSALAPFVVSLLTLFPACVGHVATHYGESYNGQQMGCVGSGLYSSQNEHIIAVGYNSPYECGDKLRVIGPIGSIDVWVVDTCPGCGPYHVDLSEAGIGKVCGWGTDICEVTIIEYPDS